MVTVSVPSPQWDCMGAVSAKVEVMLPVNVNSMAKAKISNLRPTFLSVRNYASLQAPKQLLSTLDKAVL